MDDKEWEMLNEMDDCPRVMVLGPEGSGKTSVVRTLVNWTVRAGRNWEPVLVQLDPSEVKSFILIKFLLSDPRRGRETSR